ncbi:MAG: thioredoxin family protein [Jiangellaceae bacterium]
MDVTLQYFEGCPHWRIADERLRELSAEFGFRITYREAVSPEDAEALSFHGSPSVLVDGRDPFSHGNQPVGLACRVYQTPDGPAGAPTIDQLRIALT